MIKSNLREILGKRDISIREFSLMIDYRFESVRNLYNDKLERFPRELLDRTCRELNISICDLLTFEKDEED